MANKFWSLVPLTRRYYTNLILILCKICYDVVPLGRLHSISSAFLSYGLSISFETISMASSLYWKRKTLGTHTHACVLLHYATATTWHLFLFQSIVKLENYMCIMGGHSLSWFLYISFSQCQRHHDSFFFFCV